MSTLDPLPIGGTVEQAVAHICDHSIFEGVAIWYTPGKGYLAAMIDVQMEIVPGSTSWDYSPSAVGAIWGAYHRTHDTKGAPVESLDDTYRRAARLLHLPSAPRQPRKLVRCPNCASQIDPDVTVCPACDAVLY